MSRGDGCKHGMGCEQEGVGFGQEELGCEQVVSAVWRVCEVWVFKEGSV